MSKIQVLDKGFVHLVDVMGSDKSIVNSARISFGKQVEEIGEKDEKLIRYLWKHKHTSPFRHATLQFHVKAPIFVLRQWMKHQVGCAWNEISGRYVKFDAEFYSPKTWREQHESNKQGSKGAIDGQIALMLEDLLSNSTLSIDSQGAPFSLALYIHLYQVIHDK